MWAALPREICKVVEQQLGAVARPSHIYFVKFSSKWPVPPDDPGDDR